MPQSAQSAGSQLPSINQGFQDGQTYPPNRDSYHRDSYHPSIDSRRSSVDSRMHQGLNNLYINNPTSPYESANASQISLAASLRRPNNGAPMSPLSGRSSSRASQMAPRIAPPIMPVGRQSGAPDPTAAKPTQGYAWAFPDGPIPEERRGSDSDESSLRGISRTNSLAASSIRSSIFSNDSHLPGGQRRLDDGEWSEVLVLPVPADRSQVLPPIITRFNIGRSQAFRARTCHHRASVTTVEHRSYALATSSRRGSAEVR